MTRALSSIDDGPCRRRNTTRTGSEAVRDRCGLFPGDAVPHAAPAAQARVSADGSSAAKRSASVGRDRAGQIALSSKCGSAAPSRIGL